MQNLWADEDNNVEIAPEAAKRVEKTGTVRPASRAHAEQRVVSALRAWLRTDYIAPYCRSLAATRIFRRCFLIDGLGNIKGGKKDIGSSQADIAAMVGMGERADKSVVGGEGRADKSAVGAVNRPLQGLFREEEDVLSSQRTGNHKRAQKASVPQILQPVVELAQELAQEERPITLQALLLEGDRRKRNQPEGGFTLPRESAVISAGWVDIAPSMLQAVEHSAAVFLLNPLRRRQQQHAAPFFTTDDFAPLFKRTAPTELCLLLSHAEVQEVFLPALRVQGEAAAFTALLRSDRWKALLAKEEEPARLVGDLIELWRTALQPHFLAVQRVAFPVLSGPAMVEDTPYTLLFASRRQDSLFCMNDAVCNYRRRLEMESHRGLLNEAWFAAQQQERLAADMLKLREQTLRLGRAQSPRRWPDLRQQLLLANFGAFTTRDYDETIASLLEEGEVRCDWRKSGAAGEGEAERVPGNDDIVLWKEKKRRY